MAKKEGDKRPIKKLDDPVLDSVDAMIVKERQRLLTEIEKISPNMVLQISLKSVRDDLAGHFSDWHDSWRDRDGGWAKTWGKSGGDRVVVNEVSE